MSTIDELKAISAGLSCFGLKWPLLSCSDPGVIVGLPGETCAAEGRSGRLGRDGYDSSVVNNIGAVLSGRHPLVEGFGNPGGCHQRHEGESGVAGKGKTSGHGHLGQKALSCGSSGRGPGFEGGQTPLYQPVPKPREPGQAADLRGHGPPRHQQQDHHIELGEPGLVTCSRVKHGTKLLGNGNQHLTAKLDIEVSQVSESAFKAVEAAGGSITSVYHNRLALRVKKAFAIASNSE
ncbi:Ribosomal protein L15 [Phytophthora cactorum]|nr:Ribosomal protein L15 [Phytophthora cactorum]